VIVVNDTNLILAMKIFFGILLLWFAAMAMGICYPLIQRKIKMNRFYGFRFPQSFYSEESWYKINAYGGKTLIIWAIAAVMASILLISVPMDSLALLSSVLLLVILSILIPIVFTYKYARQFERPATQ